jgi:hypothetical protein
MDTIEAEYPWKIVGTDIMDLLPTTPDKNTHIVIFMDLFTKYAKAFAISKMMQK